MSTKKTENPTPPKVGKLASLGDLRREMAKVYRSSRAGGITTRDMSRFIYALRTMGQMLEVEALEERIQRLEERTSDKSS